MSFISFRLVPLRAGGSATEKIPSALHSPLAAKLAAVLASIGLEVGNELVERIFHVHVSDLGPHFVVIREGRLLILNLARLVLEGVAVTSRAQRAQMSETGRRLTDTWSRSQCPAGRCT